MVIHSPFFRPLLAAFQGRQLKPTVILLVSSVTLVTWKCFASPQYLEQFARRCGGFSDPQAAGAIGSFVGALLLLGLLPALVVKLVFRENLADYGVGPGDRLRTMRSFLVCAPIVLLIAYLSAGSASLGKEYPISHLAQVSGWGFTLHALTYLLFYLGWEFQFRGFMQHGLGESMGPANALLVQVLASTLLHLGKPVSEIYAAILAGLLWGLLAYRTRSLLSGMLQHFLLGIALDWLICHRW
jgi:membrane protease YdiL (CAAX protease family)